MLAGMSLSCWGRYRYFFLLFQTADQVVITLGHLDDSSRCRLSSFRRWLPSAALKKAFESKDRNIFLTRVGAGRISEVRSRQKKASKLPSQQWCHCLFWGVCNRVSHFRGFQFFIHNLIVLFSYLALVFYVFVHFLTIFKKINKDFHFGGITV